MTTLAEHLRRHALDALGGRRISCCCGWEIVGEQYSVALAAHAAHAAAAWAEHRTIRTLGQLVALPGGTVIRAGDLTLDLGADPDVPDAWAVPAPARTVIDHQRVPLPATVLYNPEEDQ